MHTLAKNLVELVFTVVQGLVDSSHIIIDALNTSLRDLMYDAVTSISLVNIPWWHNSVLDLLSLGLPFLEWTLLELMFASGIGLVIAYTIIKWIIPLLD